MSDTNRRDFIYGGLAAAAVAAVPDGAQGAQRKFTLAFIPGSIGIKSDQGRSIELAAKYGFESVQPFGKQLQSEGVTKYVEMLEEAKLQWAAAGLSVSFRADQDTYASALKDLPGEAKALHSAGVTRVGTAISSASDEFNYLDNFKHHTRRLREVGSILEDNGLRLGLEYLGTKHIWISKRHAFIHSMKECLELIDAAGKSNIGVVIDSWHWWTARDTFEDIRNVSNDQVVSADLNDAPTGIELDLQRDNERELPLATGMIDAAGFLKALVDIGYDGPIRAEPFNKILNEMDDDQASETTAKAMKAAFATVG